METSAGSAPADDASSPCVDPETERLRAELEKATSKLASWKEKAKIGVDQMRQQVVDLAAALEETRAERDHLAACLAEAASEPGVVSMPSLASTGLLAPLLASNGEAALRKLTDYVADTSDWFCTYSTTKLNLFSSAVATQTCTTSALGESTRTDPSDRSMVPSPRPAAMVPSNDGSVARFIPHGTSGSPPPSTAATEDFDAYKRRVTMTLRMQTKNCETLQKQTEDLKVTVASLRDSLKDRDRSLAARDDTVALLEQRLEAAERLNRQLEEQQDVMLRGPNMDQVNAMEERMEQEVAQVRAEYSARENAIFVQHHDELDRMRAVAEQDLAQARREFEERLAMATEELGQRGDNGRQGHNANGLPRSEDDAGSPTSRRDDAAYGKLLSEYELLEDRLRVLEEENIALRQDAAYYRANTTARTSQGGRLAASQPSALAPPSRTEAEDPMQELFARANPATLQEACGTIAEQHAMLVSLSEQLWSVKKELLDAQRAKDAPAADPRGLDPQQALYLKSILVRSLCSRTDDKVLMNLLPVISTMLHFDSSDLKDIYHANPSWISTAK